jgi:hypothetical protein
MNLRNYPEDTKSSDIGIMSREEIALPRFNQTPHISKSLAPKACETLLSKVPFNPN